MQITLPDGRKATVIGQVTDKMSKIKFEDGRETLWPTDKLPKQTEGEEPLKLVVIPAIDRLEEFIKDLRRVDNVNDFRDNNKMTSEELKLFDDLLFQSEIDIKEKWGL